MGLWRVKACSIGSFCSSPRLQRFNRSQDTLQHVVALQGLSTLSESAEAHSGATSRSLALQDHLEDLLRLQMRALRQHRQASLRRARCFPRCNEWPPKQIRCDAILDEI